jgi:hypothetical protein
MSIYTFVLLAPLVPLEQIEGALAERSPYRPRRSRAAPLRSRPRARAQLSRRARGDPTPGLPAAGRGPRSLTSRAAPASGLRTRPAEAPRRPAGQLRAICLFSANTFAPARATARGSLAAERRCRLTRNKSEVDGQGSAIRLQIISECHGRNGVRTNYELLPIWIGFVPRFIEYVGC